MAPSMYLVNPASTFATYFSAEVLAGSGRRGGAIIGDLATTTLAALAPPDFEIASAAVLLIVNPPYGLAGDMQDAFGPIAPRLGHMTEARLRVDWLAGGE